MISGTFPISFSSTTGGSADIFVTTDAGAWNGTKIASVGVTETQAREAGMEVVTEKVDFRAIGKANMLREGGSVKLVAEAGGPVRGVHMIGPHVTDLIAEGMLITNWEAFPDEVAAMMHPHPSLSEGIGEAHLALAGKPLHTP